MSTRFHPLRVARIDPEAAGAVAIALQVPDSLRDTFDFTPGQYLTLRSHIEGSDTRRSYSICCTHQHYFCSSRNWWSAFGPCGVGCFPTGPPHSSRWATHWPCMPPQGRFVSRRPRALHRVGFAAGSGITPILSILASALQDQAESRFTLVYGNRNMASVMFNEALQDLKDAFADRLTLIHVLSRQAQEVDLLQGRIDGDKVRAIVAALLPVASMDEVFICGPEAMIEATEKALLDAGVPARQLHTERFSSPTLESLTPQARQAALEQGSSPSSNGQVALTVVLDGKAHALKMDHNQHVLDAALAAGLDLPFSCKGGVCATCRCKLTQGQVTMDKNFGLEAWETDQGFVLSCQARPVSETVTVSFDDR
jgi:ring-1,2-phenylacetyl-CoA epoxidase subunit PaaE